VRTLHVFELVCCVSADRLALEAWATQFDYDAHPTARKQSPSPSIAADLHAP